MTKYTLLPALPEATEKSHHVGNPPTQFRNPWPSVQSGQISLTAGLKLRFMDKKPPFVPVPTDRTDLVQVQTPDFNIPQGTVGINVTWIGHASFLVQCFTDSKDSRPLNILLDPVFSERTSPFTFIGPKRYSPLPCSLDELLTQVPIDLVCISHNHYDHADADALKTINNRSATQGQDVLFCVALGNSRWLTSIGISSTRIWEGDWWDRIEVPLPPLINARSNHSDAITGSLSSPIPIATTEQKNGPSDPSTGVQAANNVATVKITCTPSQHTSARTTFDKDSDLWCSWSFELASPSNRTQEEQSTDIHPSGSASITKSLFFAGDTGYRTVPQADPYDGSTPPLSELPFCPAFAQIGSRLGPFDLALLPIGLNRPRHYMSSVHANAADSMDIHRDVKAKRSVGMHWGTFRGGISALYEPVTDPPKEWEEEARKAGKVWRHRKSRRENDTQNPDGSNSSGDWEIGLLDIGESVSV